MRTVWHLPWPAFLLVLLAAEGGAVALAPHGAGDLPGDAGLYAAAAHSIVFDRDLDLLNQCYPHCHTLADAVPELTGEHGGEFGLGARGELTLKQSPVLALCAAPFYALLGLAGCVLFNLLLMTLLLAGVVRLAGGPAGQWAALLLFVTTPLWKFAVDLSPDVFLCALLVGGLLAARAGRPGLCGLFLGVAAGAKVYVVALALPVALVAVFAAPVRGKALVSGLLGGLLGLAPAAAFNAYQYGRPWVTGYERQLLVENGTVTVAGHASRFTEPPLRGVANLLFDPSVGLLPTAPLVVFTGPAAVLLAARRRFRGWPAGALGVAVVNVAVFATYDGWHGGSPAGNRYLFPAVVCGFAVIGAAASEWTGCARRAGSTAGEVGEPGK